MPTPREVQQLIHQLHQSKIINAETPALGLVEAVNQGFTNPGLVAGWYVLGGDHYVIVCGASSGDIAELGA